MFDPPLSPTIGWLVVLGALGAPGVLAVNVL